MLDRIGKLGLVFLLMCSLLEIVSFFINQKIDRRPLFVDTFYLTPKYSENIKVDYSTYDPLLGWNNDSRIKRQRRGKGPVLILGDDSKDDFKVIILGGSTSDLTYSRDNWPHHAFQSLHAEYRISFYILAVGGYDFQQELLSYIRDGSEIQANMVISYSGTNEDLNIQYAPLEGVREVHKRLNLIALKPSSLLFPNVFSLILSSTRLREVKSIYKRGDTEKNTYHREWIDAIERLHDIVAADGARFFYILQPNLGISPSILSDREKGILESVWDETREKFYATARGMLNKDYMLNFEDLFISETDIYVDMCHLNSRGNRILGKRMEEFIESNIPRSFRKNRESIL